MPPLRPPVIHTAENTTEAPGDVARPAASRCRALCSAVGVADRVVVAGGRYTGRAGVLVRTADLHQGRHVVRLTDGATVRVSTAYVHRAGCPAHG